ncbi:hypothetical protein THAOC_25593, partial [Thalassiosira oceanica]
MLFPLSSLRGPSSPVAVFARPRPEYDTYCTFRPTSLRLSPTSCSKWSASAANRARTRGRLAPNGVACPVLGCICSDVNHPRTGKLKNKFDIMNHLGGAEHCTIAPPLVDLTVCHKSGITFCTHGDCPLLPKERFFPSLEDLLQHDRTHHPTAPPHTSTHTSPPSHRTHPATPPATAPAAQVSLSPPVFPPETDPAQPSSWEDALQFLASPSHQPPAFRTNWYHFLKRRHQHEFYDVFYCIIQAINIASARSDPADTDWKSSASGFYWLLVHLEHLILAPTNKTDSNGESIQQTIRRRLAWFRQGRIRGLHVEAVRVSSWYPEYKPSYLSYVITNVGDRPARDGRQDAQEAADNDNFKSARDRACNPPPVAQVGNNNFASVTDLYSE